MLDHIRPHYAKKFRCTGSACQQNCCCGWDVIVDRATYQRYEAHPAIRPILQQCFELFENPTETKTAQIRYPSSLICPFLTPEQLCRLQQEYGDDYLCVTCATYPRISRRIEGLLEAPLSLSCPEAAQLVLLDPHLMPENERPGQNRYSPFLRKEERNDSGDCNPLRFFWKIREFALLLVRDQAYPLWQRLFLLGMFCKRLDEVITARRSATVPGLLSKFAEMASQKNLGPAMDGIPVRTAVQVEMLMQVVFGCLATKNPRFSRIDQHLQEFLRGIGYDSAPYLESCTRLYEQAYAQFFHPFMERNAFMLENYLVNHIFRTRFPFGMKAGNEFDRPQYEYVWMCLEFAAIKGLLIGISGYHREAFASDHVVSLIQAFTRSTEHTPAIRESLNWQGLSDPNSIAALLKN